MYKSIFSAGGIVLLASLIGCNSPTPEENAKRTCEDRFLSYSYAKDFIKVQLKAPSTADFPSFANIKHQYLGDCRHRLVGKLNAQNSFGAMVSNYFDVTVEYDKNRQTYSLVNSTIK